MCLEVISLQCLLNPCFLHKRCTVYTFNWIVVEESSCSWLFIYLITHLIKNISPNVNLVCPRMITDTRCSKNVHAGELCDKSSSVWRAKSDYGWGRLQKAQKSRDGSWSLLNTMKNILDSLTAELRAARCLGPGHNAVLECSSVTSLPTICSS